MLMMLIEFKNYVIAAWQQFTSLRIQLNPLQSNALKMSKS